MGGGANPLTACGRGAPATKIAGAFAIDRALSLWPMAAMTPELAYDKTKYDEGEAAFLRGITVARLIDQLKIEAQDPHEKERDDPSRQVTAEQREKWADEETAREQRAAGLLLGYLNGVLQAIRRIDNQLMQSPPTA